MALSVNIKKKLGDFLLNVRFEAENEVLALLGASGCGKSVTLRCIAGIMTPDEGRIVLDGETLFDSEKKINLPPQKRAVGFLFQQYALFPNMTVRQNIECVISDKKCRSAETSELLRRFQLESVQNQRPSELSGGQQQRAALARILATKPQVLLLDEPFSALDSFLKAQLEQELRDTLDDFPGTVLWVSHDRDEVFRNCDKVCVVDGGVSQPVTTPQRLFENPKTVAAAKLSGCKNLLPVEAENGGIFVPCWNVRLKCGDTGKSGSCFAGIRSHHLHFCEAGEPNAIACNVVRTMDNVFSTIVILRPAEAAPDAPTLQMETEKVNFTGETAYVAVEPENILVLE